MKESVIFSDILCLIYFRELTRIRYYIGTIYQRFTAFSLFEVSTSGVVRGSNNSSNPCWNNGLQQLKISRWTYTHHIPYSINSTSCYATWGQYRNFFFQISIKYLFKVNFLNLVCCDVYNQRLNHVLMIKKDSIYFIQNCFS